MSINKRIIAKAMLFIMILSLITGIFAGCSKNNENIVIDELSQLDGRPVGYLIDSSFLGEIENKFPNSEKLGYNSYSELISALKSGRVDAYFVDEPIGIRQIKETQGINLVGKPIVNERYGCIFNIEKESLRNEFNSMLQILIDDGTVDFLIEKWIKGDGDDSLSFDESIPTPKGVIRVGVEDDSIPFVYVKNENVVGYEVELLYTICAKLGYKPELSYYDFSSLLPAVIGGRADMGIGCITYTDERAESLLFSDSIYNGGPVAMVRSAAVTEEYTKISQLDGKNIGYLSGSAYIEDVKSKLPNSKSYEYESPSDLVQSLKTNIIDAYIADEPVARVHIRETNGLKIIEDTLTENEYGFILGKSQTELLSQINGVLRKLKAEGKLEKLNEKWIKGDGDANLSFDDNIPTPKGVLEVSVTADSMPFSYVTGDGKIVGYDVELLYMICEELGYKPHLTNYPFPSLISTIDSGRAPLAIGCIIRTEERAQKLLFTDTTYQSGTVAVVLNGGTKNFGFIKNLKESFNKNLVEENRWKMVLRGLWVTIELSVLSLILGTLLGFLFSFILRSKSKLLSGISNIISVILDGLPLLIILMVFYYIVFAKTSVSAIAIGVIGLSLDFANCVAGILNTGIIAVDKGQIEAAKAMGYSNLMTFKKITFPQAANQMFGSYSSAVISLIKGTSVIGYIAVEDLTKVSDIIMSRTFEAFFPLIFTAIIYFILARIFVSLLAIFAKKLDPKHRARKVKGVFYHD